jgi:hypothetical protein
MTHGPERAVVSQPKRKEVLSVAARYAKSQARDRRTARGVRCHDARGELRGLASRQGHEEYERKSGADELCVTGDALARRV